MFTISGQKSLWLKLTVAQKVIWWCKTIVGFGFRVWKLTYISWKKVRPVFGCWPWASKLPLQPSCYEYLCSIMIKYQNYEFLRLTSRIQHHEQRFSIRTPDGISIVIDFIVKTIAQNRRASHFQKMTLCFYLFSNSWTGDRISHTSPFTLRQ